MIGSVAANVWVGAAKLRETDTKRKGETKAACSSSSCGFFVLQRICLRLSNLSSWHSWLVRSRRSKPATIWKASLPCVCAYMFFFLRFFSPLFFCYKMLTGQGWKWTSTHTKNPKCWPRYGPDFLLSLHSPYDRNRLRQIQARQKEASSTTVKGEFVVMKSKTFTRTWT